MKYFMDVYSKLSYAKKVLNIYFVKINIANAVAALYLTDIMNPQRKQVTSSFIKIIRNKVIFLYYPCFV